MTSLIKDIQRRAAERSKRTIRLVNPEDAAQVFVARVPTDGMEIERLRAAAERADRGKAAGVHFSRALVALCVEQIEDAGEVVELNDTPVTFRDPELWAELGVKSAKDAVVALIGSDGVISALADKLVEEAGYGDGDAIPDPTGV